MTRLPELQEQLVAAAGRLAAAPAGGSAARRRVRVVARRAPALAAGLVVALAVALVISLQRGGDPGAGPPGAAGPAGFERQLGLLGVLRTALPPDATAPVRAALRVFDRAPNHGSYRANYTRLLASSHGGDAVLLVAARRYATDAPAGSAARWLPHSNGLCLVARIGSSRAVDCYSTAQLLRNQAFSAVGGRVYGLVPDHVVNVRPARGGPFVPVRRNFYRYAAPTGHGRIRPPAWYDARGREVTGKAPALTAADVRSDRPGQFPTQYRFGFCPAYVTGLPADALAQARRAAVAQMGAAYPGRAGRGVRATTAEVVRDGTARSVDAAYCGALGRTVLVGLFLPDAPSASASLSQGAVYVSRIDPPGQAPFWELWGIEH